MAGKTRSKGKFVEKARSIHGDKYDYSEVVYSGYKSRVTIICPVHGRFEQTPSKHVMGNGCMFCGQMRNGHKSRTGTIEFIRRARERHGERYDYSLVEYLQCDTKVCIVCAVHGEFWQRPACHVRGYGCERCSHEYRGAMMRSGFDEFLEAALKSHNGLYSYKQDSFRGMGSSVVVTCPEHGDWVASSACNHVKLKTKCPQCGRKSTGEEAVAEELVRRGLVFTRQAKFPSLPRLSFDFYLPSMGLLIEFDGEQHFRPIEFFGGKDSFLITRERDERKNRWAWENGYMLMRIPYWMRDRIPELLHRQLTMFVPEAA